MSNMLSALLSDSPQTEGPISALKSTDKKMDTEIMNALSFLLHASAKSGLKPGDSSIASLDANSQQRVITLINDFANVRKNEWAKQWQAEYCVALARALSASLQGLDPALEKVEDAFEALDLLEEVEAPEEEASKKKAPAKKRGKAAEKTEE